MALVYFGLMVGVGDIIARPILRPGSALHRLAAAFLVGLLLSTWATYLVASLLSPSFVQPLAVADPLVMSLATVILGLRAAGSLRAWRFDPPDWFREAGRRVRSSWRGAALDWVVIGIAAGVATWVMVWTLRYANGEILLGAHEEQDFGVTVSLAQSFALGHNYPTEYPFFSGVPIQYHFLYYFQVGNLTFLGLDPAAANNLLSVASIVALLAAVLTLGRRLFRSAVVGRLGALLFFFHGSLAFVPYLMTFDSPADALGAISARTFYLSSGLPFRGETWGIWSMGLFANQRHFASAIGILVLVIIFVADRLADRTGDSSDAVDSGDIIPAKRLMARVRAGLAHPSLPAYVAVGALLGLLPLWNGHVFIASAAILAVVFVIFPNRVQMAGLAVAAALVALPQVLFLRQPGLASSVYPAFHWGYTIDPPTLTNIASFFASDFGPKIALLGFGLLVASRTQRGVFLAAIGAVVVAFTVQLTIDGAINHKLLNLWLIVANVFAAWGLVRLWRVGAPAGLSRWMRGGVRALGGLTAIVLAGMIVVGGLIDVMPIKNEFFGVYRLSGDRLSDWVIQQTKPTDVFLTDTFRAHVITLAGRKVYFGAPELVWESGYDVDARKVTYDGMLEGTNASDVLGLLQANQIAYVAIDAGLRSGTEWVGPVNEGLFQANFEQVFEDQNNRDGHLVIYRIPPGPAAGGPETGTPGPGSSADGGPTAVPVSMFTGGRGSNRGQFFDPRGIAIAPDGDILVADPGNNRVERFTPDGAFRDTFGGARDQPAQLHEPNGVGVDSRGHIFVADTLNGRLQEFDASSSLVQSWSGPDPGFFGPRDVAIGADDSIYVLDQGHGRVARRTTGGATTSFGSLGSGPGQLNDASGLVVADDQVFVADSGNDRVQVFGTDGRFVRSVPVPEWSTPGGYPDVAVSPDGRVLYASSPTTNEVLVFTIDGRRSGSLKPAGADALAGPGALAVRPDGRILVIDFEGSRVSELAPAP